MERKTQFRGQRKDNGELVYGYYLMYPVNKNPINDNHYIINYEWSDDFGYADKRYQVLPQTVTQYVGTNDIDGNPIYEGDIIQYICNGILQYREVYWDESIVSFLSRNTHFKDDLTLGFSWMKLNGSIKVIGNIFQHPELVNIPKSPNFNHQGYEPSNNL